MGLVSCISLYYYGCVVQKIVARVFCFLTGKISIFRWQFNLASILWLGLGLAAGIYLSGHYISKIFAANELTNQWSFAVNGDYLLSDSNLIEISGGTASLKTRNYDSDANTALLLHLDEDGGNATDSSSYSHLATGSGVAFATGQLNNAATASGLTPYITVADHSSLSLSQNLTLESWVKFPNGFSANSRSHRQGVLDKGTYQLYFDNQTGKLNFELAPSNADNWTQLAGTDIVNANGATKNQSWDLNSKNLVWRQVMMGTDLYVVLGNVVGDAEVWKCTSCATSPVWSMIGGDGINSSWADATFEEAPSVATDGTNLYVGLGNTAGDGEVWKYDGSSWSKIGGDTVNSSWANSTYEAVYSLAAAGGNVYAGLGNSAGDAEVWKYNGSSWSQIGGDALNSSWANATYEWVSSLIVVNSDTLVAGLGATAGDAEVWSTPLSSNSWSKRGGDGSGAGDQSWATSTFESVYSMTSSGTVLYVGLGVSTTDAEVWRCDLASTCTATAGWTKVGGDGVNSSFNTNYERVWDLAAVGTSIVAVIGDSAGDAEVWRCNSCSTSPSWAQIGGDGNATPPQSWNNAFTSATSLAVTGSGIFVGASYTSASVGAEVWYCADIASCTTTTNWSRIGGQLINKSWGMYNLQSVESLTSYGSNLYAGTGNATNGNATVWKYDGTNWSLIGGQGVNSSWAANSYRAVYALTNYNGTVIAGIGGATANQAEVWKFDGSTWTQIGGDASGSGGQSWANNTYELASQLTMAGSKLIVGLGSSGGDGEVWMCDMASTCTTTAGWTKLGGDGTGSSGQSWTNAYEQITSLAIAGNSLYVGLSATTGDAEVWTCDLSNCTVTAGWTKLGGDGLSSSWNTVYEYVDSLAFYGGQLYAGLALTAGDAEIWKYNGSTWTQIGGDGLNSGWADSTYERVRTMATYNGELYAGLGLSAGDGEVWKYNGVGWSRVGGDGSNNGWFNVVESVPILAVYNGKLIAGTGDTGNADSAVWAYGGNSIVSSTTSAWDSGWHHVAATYDGTTMRLYVDGSLESSLVSSLTLLDSTNQLVVGSTAGGSKDLPQGYFLGMLDEVRISNSVRSSFNSTAYTADAQTVRPANAVWTSQMASFDSFVATESANGGSIVYRLSQNGGNTWKYWNGSSWHTSSSLTDANGASVINTNIGSFPVGDGGILWQAILDGDGTQDVSLSGVVLGGTPDTTAPTDPSNFVVRATNSGGVVFAGGGGNYYPYSQLYISWDASVDSGAGVNGYYVYLGTDPSAEPSQEEELTASTNATFSGLSSGTYYLRVKAVDNAQNYTGIIDVMTINLDITSPSSPTALTVTPAGYTGTNSYTFSWPTAGSSGGATDSGGSSVVGYQYKTATASGTFSGWSATTSATTVTLADVAYQDNANVFYLRSVDGAGNVSATPAQINFYFAGEGASPPQFLTVSPQTNTANSFAFSWQSPASHSGDDEDLTYCYTVNTLPSATTCSFTSAGVTILSAGAFATQVGINTFYIVAKNPEDQGGAINYGSYSSVTFTANTSAPGIPLNGDVADISIKSTGLWRLTISWNAPSDTGSGVSNYQIYRSLDGESYSHLATTTGLAYVDTDLEQQVYYYKVKACDNVSNCGAFTSVVSATPTGKYTDPAGLSSGPTSSSVTTKKAVISWSTDRDSDSKVQYGTSGGSYFTEEPSNSTQTTDHTITLNNLTPGTTYYYRAKWTDEDGNTGTSEEKTFSTEAAPTIKNVKLKTISLTNAVLEFTASGATKVKVYYGQTSAFGGMMTVETATTESTYTTIVEDLLDGTKYFYKINALDAEGSEYEGTILDFTTLPRPKISNIRIQQVAGTAQPTVLVTWQTNTETSSIVTYYPEGKNSESKDEVNVALTKGDHRILIRGLLTQTPYVLIVKGRDKAGNEAASTPQKFTTATDNRPPQITNLRVEGAILPGSSGGNDATAQLIVSWDTDEPSTAQVEFGEGTGSSYAQKTQEEASTTSNHVVVISGLTPSKVYHLRAISKDKAGNAGMSVDTATITPKATDNALNLVISNLSEAFGFLGGIAQ